MGFELLLVASHLVALALGALAGRWLTVRNLVVIEHDGHPALELRHEDPQEGPSSASNRP